MTEETKFTPGPWRVWADDEVFAENGGDSLVVVPDSSCGRDVYGELMVRREESRYNSHLIASAPRLYKEVQRALDAINRLAEEYGAIPVYLDDLAPDLEDALFEARG